MYNFVQYHKEEERGPYQLGTFRIVTSKRFNSLEGSRVWLISGVGRPRQYYLCETFIVDRMSRAKNDTKHYEASGKGTRFKQPVRIDSETWFKRMLIRSANFSIGLHVLSDQSVLAGLRRVLEQQVK